MYIATRLLLFYFLIFTLFHLFFLIPPCLLSLPIGRKVPSVIDEILDGQFLEPKPSDTF